MGIPSIWGKTKHYQGLAYVRERIEYKIQDWQKSTLPYGGREVMIKVVLNVIRNFKELNSIIIKFWWDTLGESGTTFQKFWTHISQSKEYEV